MQIYIKNLVIFIFVNFIGLSSAMEEKEKDPQRNDRIKGINNLASFAHKNLAQMREMKTPLRQDKIQIQSNGQLFGFKNNDLVKLDEDSTKKDNHE